MLQALVLMTAVVVASAAEAMITANAHNNSMNHDHDDDDSQQQQHSKYVFEVLGTIGGTLIALSLAPQVYKTYQTRSALDISYFYQGIYIVGLSLVNLYAIVEGLWPVYVP